jgi:SAM-dependent methyltransferase
VNTPGVCRYCKNPNTTILYSAQDTHDNVWIICKCPTCKAIFLSPEPSPEQLKQAYDAGYYGEGENKFGFSVETFIDYFRKKRAKSLASKLCENARILDVGCGNGRFLFHLSRISKFDLNGIELQGGSADRAAKIKEINLKIGALTDTDFAENSFDAITLFHVFEHLDKPRETLDIIGKLLKKDGILILSFPNISGWQSKVFKANWYHLDPPRHLVFFDPSDIIEIMKSRGYAIVKKNWFSFEQNPYGWVQSFLNSWCGRREVLYERLKGNKNYASGYGSINIFFQKLFFMFSFSFFVGLDLIESLFGKSATVQLTFKKN